MTAPTQTPSTERAIRYLFGRIAEGERMLALNRVERLILQAQLDELRGNLKDLIDIPEVMSEAPAGMRFAEPMAQVKNEYYHNRLGH